MLFCIFITELKNCRRQRQRVRWLHGHWAWIREIWKFYTGKDTPESCPSQSTLSRILQSVDLWALMQQYYARRISSRREEEPGATEPLMHYAIDGKCRAGIVSPETGRTEIDVTIFDVRTREVLALKTLPDKQGESVAVQGILKQKARSLLRGVFSGDAGITSPKVTARMVAAGHEYLLAIKENAGGVYNICQSMDWENTPIIAETRDEEHGREEIRQLRRIALGNGLAEKFSKYSKCRYLYQITSIRIVNGEATKAVRYYIGSRGLKGQTGKEIMKIIREHWLIENGLHWVKDAILAEDKLPVMSNRSSRVLGFFKSIVVTIGYAIYRSVQQFVDEFDARPQEFMRKLLKLE